MARVAPSVMINVASQPLSTTGSPLMISEANRFGRTMRQRAIGFSTRNAVDFETVGFTPVLSEQHVHFFFFDTVPPSQAGLPGAGLWLIYGGASPFTGQTVAGTLAAADRICVIIANAAHTIDVDSANCFALP